MFVFKIIAIVIITTLIILILKEEKREFSYLLTLVVSLIIMIFLLQQIKVVINILEKLIDSSKLQLLYFDEILRIIGIAYIGEFGAEITKDAGEITLAKKIEFATKLVIMIIILPILINILEIILTMIP